jgi:SAM-dependent methyltransferase
MKSTERFSDRVENYVRYRPHYPAAIIDCLKKERGLTKNHTIADIGSGTGISSELFLLNGNRVYGIEPNDEMRKAAEEIYKDKKNFISVNGTAENTTLPDAGIDFIIAGQAFHWFDADKAKTEFKRIAAPNVWLLLIWNERKQNSPFQQAYEELLFRYAPGYNESTHRNIKLSDIEKFFAPEKCRLHSFDNTQMFDFDGLKGRLLSSSYVPLQNSNLYQPMIEALQSIFSKFSKNGFVAFDYDCNLYYGKV